MKSKIHTLATIVTILALTTAACSAIGPTAYSPNGETIYQTGVSENTGRISYDFEGMGQGMMGQGYSNQLACADCHGEDARGGSLYMRMQKIEAPDIRWSDLQQDLQEEGEIQGDYTFEMFKQAVVYGIDPAGDHLDPMMPQWHISDQDLRDVMEYLKSIDNS